jgi:hypothetical protein
LEDTGKQHEKVAWNVCFDDLNLCRHLYGRSFRGNGMQLSARRHPRRIFLDAGATNLDCATVIVGIVRPQLRSVPAQETLFQPTRNAEDHQDDGEDQENQREHQSGVVRALRK